MNEKENELVLLEPDYHLLKNYIRSFRQKDRYEKINAEQLENELNNGFVLMDKSNYPLDAVCLNSIVTIQDNQSGEKLEFTLVLPGFASLCRNRISIFAPIGTAVIGYRKGQTVTWQMPKGRKNFTIIEVRH